MDRSDGWSSVPPTGQKTEFSTGGPKLTSPSEFVIKKLIVATED
jgi:hypothetical protein